jgi:hypothetical protein
MLTDGKLHVDLQKSFLIIKEGLELALLQNVRVEFA